MNQTVTVLKPAWVAERGNQIPDWDYATKATVTGCRLQPAQGDEVHFSGSSSTDGGTARDAVITRFKLFGPPGMDVSALDRVTFRGRTFEVEGPPQHWPSPTGLLVHTELYLRVVEG